MTARPLAALEQFDRICAVFAPKRTDDLKPGVAAHIGRETEWEALWIIEEGAYAGQWAMAPRHGEGWPMAWAPLGDLTPVVTP